jgi:hypothetical protein
LTKQTASLNLSKPEITDKIVDTITQLASNFDILDSSLADKATKQDIANMGSASPKGVYTTLSALQTAFPTGTVGIYLVTADGGWYYWNGSAWTKGGTYQGTGIPAGAVPYLVVNNTLSHGNFDSSFTGWTQVTLTNASVTSNVATFTATASNGGLVNSVAFTNGKKYYLCASVKADSASVKLNVGGINNVFHPGDNVFHTLSETFTWTSSTTNWNVNIFDGRSSGWTPVSVQQVMVVCLTDMYGAGNEPSLTDFEAFIKQYNSGSVFVASQLVTPVITPNVVGASGLQASSVTLPKLGTDVSNLINSKVSYASLGNMLSNSTFVDTSVWIPTLSTWSVSGNVATFTATASLGQLKQVLLSSISSHVYYVKADVQAATNNAKLHLYNSGTGSPYATVLHSGSGNFEKLSAVVTVNEVATLAARVIDYSSSGWTPISIKNFIVSDLTAIFGAGNEPSLSDYETMIKNNNGGTLSIPSSITTNTILGKVYPVAIPTITYPLFVNQSGNMIDVITKYSDTQDLRVNLNNNGNNNIFNFAGLYLIPNTTNTTSNSYSGGSALVTIGTDWLGPHVILAVNNINGDLPSSTDFTGGNHGYNPDATGSHTGRTTLVELYVDGRKTTNFSGYANYVDIYWSNNVQASNTKKADGTGREVLTENYHLHYDGFKWEIDCHIQFLEDVNWQTYYGLQCSNGPWNDSIFYHSSSNRKWNVGTIDSTSGTKTTNLVTLKKGNDRLDMGIDNNIGIGDRSFLFSGDGSFTKSYSKTYFNLIASKSLQSGDTVSYKGFYRFYNK